MPSLAIVNSIHHSLLARHTERNDQPRATTAHHNQHLQHLKYLIRYTIVVPCELNDPFINIEPGREGEVVLVSFEVGKAGAVDTLPIAVAARVVEAVA
jgi:hypothetical protein